MDEKSEFGIYNYSGNFDLIWRAMLLVISVITPLAILYYGGGVPIDTAVFIATLFGVGMDFTANGAKPKSLCNEIPTVFGKTIFRFTYTVFAGWVVFLLSVIAEQLVKATWMLWLQTSCYPIFPVKIALVVGVVCSSVVLMSVAIGYALRAIKMWHWPLW